jgi:CubicO group peptidase (beta-lactamase class C family)
MTSIDDLFEEIQRQVDSAPIPACQVAVGHSGVIVAFHSFGQASNSTRFSIFSTTKPIVASMTWLLIGRGELAASDQIGQYIPELTTAGLGQVTLEQVMLHTGGFPNAVMPEAEGGQAAFRRARIATWSAEWPAGTRFEYHSDSAHWVLADLIERVTGLDFRDAIAQQVCAPLGIERSLGIPLSNQQDICDLVPMSAEAQTDSLLRYNNPQVRVAGNPGGGGIMTAANLALFYQGVLHNPGQLWNAEVLNDATTNIRCRFEDPLMGVPVNRTLGLVVAGDDGLHELRYAIFGRGCSPAAFGHAGAHAQVAWADPATGISFAFLTNAAGDDMMQAGIRSNRLASIAAELEL